MLGAAAKYWVRVKHRAKEEPVRQCYGWQVGQPRVECWKRRLRKNWILQNWATYCKMRDRQTVLWMAGWTTEGGVLETETKEELDTTELGYIRQNAGRTDIRTAHHITKLRCADI